MIIAIDGYEANVGRRVGVSRYAYSIIRHLYEIRGNIRFRTYFPEPYGSDFPKESEGWDYRIRGPKKFWTFFGLPISLAADRPKADVVFSPTHYIPRFTSIPRVMVIMDLSYLRFPELFRQKDLYQLVHWTRYSAQHARRILTISEYSKHDIINEYRIPEERVIVTYPGISLSAHMHNPDEQKLLDTYGIRGSYILAVGTIQPRKNFVRLIQAFSQIYKELSSSNSPAQLIIVGKKGWLYEETLSAPAKYGVREEVKFLDFIPDGDLQILYRHAVCFALPSLYEGFGLPVLEAMAQKCPVVVSRSSSLPEIAGPAGIYVDPESIQSICDGLLQAYKEAGKTAGSERIQKGLSHIHKFSWKEAAKKTLEILESVGKGTV